MPFSSSNRLRRDKAKDSSSDKDIPSSSKRNGLLSPPNPKRHSLDSIHHAYSSSSRSSAIPRGNGHQAMSIPMPPPPSLYFSLLPNNSSAPHSASSSPRQSPAGQQQKRKRSKSTSAYRLRRQANSEPSTPLNVPSLTLVPAISLTASNPTTPSNGNGGLQFTPASTATTTTTTATAAATATTGGGHTVTAPSSLHSSHYHTHHHAPRSTYPLSVTHSRRSSISHMQPGPVPSGANTGVNDGADPRQKLGFFDMAIFDPSPDLRPKSARSSVDHDRTSHRMTVSRPPSIESINSTNSVPFAPPPPPPPSAWKQFTNHFSTRVIKRHIKFLVALYIASVMALVPQISNVLGPTPYLANVAVVFMHPARTVGSQLEVTLFSVLGGFLAALWILPCQIALAAFNRRYLAEGNNSAWAISAVWFFLGVWIMTTYKARYAKLNCTFIIYTITGIFALTVSHTNLHFNFNADFWYLMGPLMLGVAICLVVSVLVWPETASEGLGRALNESLDTSRALLNLSTRSFLLNHKTIALPKSAIDKAQAEVRMAQKKLFSAYREARYEVTYSLNNPADYKEVRVILSALMRHLGSMSLVVQNERLLMLGHPDRDDEDLLTQSGGESYYTSGSSSESDSESESESDQSPLGAKQDSRSDYFGSSTALSQEDGTDPKNRGAGPHDRHRHHHRRKSHLAESPTSEDEHVTHHKRIQRRGSAAELRRIRQLLKRAENSTQAALKARQQNVQRQQKEQLQQSFQFQRGGVATAPPSPTGRGVFSIFGHHQSHKSKGSISMHQNGLGEGTETPSSMTSPFSSRANSIHEEHNLDTVKSFKSLFSVRSGSRMKSKNRPASLKAGFKLGHGKRRKDESASVNPSVEMLPGIPLEDSHFATLPTHLGFDHQGDARLSESRLRKAAEAYKKNREKEVKRERKQAEKLAKAAQEAQEREQQAEAAARAIPPKEVAFGDRKLFMSFLDIVRDPLQRLSDTCSRVMVAMERELVAGMDVEQDRLERLRRRDAQRTAAVKAAEIRLAEEEKAASAGANLSTHPSGASSEGEMAQKSLEKSSVLDRLKVIVGVQPSHLTKEDMEYAEAIKTGMEKKAKASKSRIPADTVHPNRFLHANLQRSTTSSGVVEEDEFVLPVGMSYVQYLTQELEIFDEAEAKGLRDFISTHPTLDVGPREEIFLIFFFLFALREIARELLRLGTYIEELDEKSRESLEEEGRTKRRKQLWWPKVMGNFWHWFAWGNYTQVKTSEGHNAVILNTTKNLEHRQPRTVEEEKAVVEAKAAKVAAEKAAAAETMATERKHRRRHSETWDLPPLRRSVTLSAMIHRGGKNPDLEQGLGGQFTRDPHHNERRVKGVLKHASGGRSRSSSHGPVEGDWTRSQARRHYSNEDIALTTIADRSRNRSSDHEVSPRPVDLGDPSAMGTEEVLGTELDEARSPHVAFEGGKGLQKYTVVDIPEFGSLKRRGKQDLQYFENSNQVELLPKLNVVKSHNTAPPDLDLFGGSGSSSSGKRRETIFAARSSTHQDRYPSFTSSTSPALMDAQHASDSTAVASRGKSQDDSVHSSYSEGTSQSSRPQSEDRSRIKSRTQSLFAAFSRNARDSDSEESSEKKATPNPPTRTIFVNVRKPKTWRYKVWEFLQPFKSEEFKFGFKMAVALTFIGLWSWLQWNSVALATDRGQWAMMTVMAVLSPTVGATFSVCAMRIGGTLAGTLWALLTFLVLPKNPWVICAMMLIISFVGIFLILETSHPKLGIIMLLSYSSITFIMYEGRSSETIYEVCYKRAVTVIIGIIVSVIMNTFLWPILARRQLRKEIAILIGRQGVLFAEIINKFLLEDPPETEQSHKNIVVAEDVDDGYSLEEEEDEEARLKYAEQPDPFKDSFVERAEKESQESRRRKRESRARRLNASLGTENNDGDSDRNKVAARNGLAHQVDDIRNQIDPDRLAFQHVEHQLQTKLIKILELLELSGSEPRLKEDFPMKLYKQIIQCCQNILDRMVSMRMAAQLLSPEVRDLVTGPMNYYRRDMVGALLLYFSVLSSSLASKSPLPPYLPSARMARLRVIYNVREAIAARQAETGEDHYTYIYYYAFSSALEEVIEELELLAILIKPIVGVTLVSSGDQYSYGLGQATEPLHMPANLCTGTGAVPDAAQTGAEDVLPTTTTINTPGGTLSQTHYSQHAGLGGSLRGGSLSSVPGLPAGMVNVNMTNPATAGTGAGAFGSPLSPGLGLGALHTGLSTSGSNPQQRQYLHERLLQQQHAQRNRRALRTGQSYQASDVEASDVEARYDNDVEEPVAPTERELSLQRQLKEMAAQKEALERQIQEQHQKLLLLAAKDGAVRDPSVGKPALGRQKSTGSGEVLNAHPLARGLHIDIPISTPPVTSAGSSSLAIPSGTKSGVISKAPHAARPPTSPLLLIDENLLLGGSGLGGRHSLRYKEAVETAQEASGQRLVEVPTSPLVGVTVVPGHVQVPVGHATSTPAAAAAATVLARSNSGKKVESSSHQHHHHHQHQHQNQKRPSRGHHEHDLSARSPASANSAQFTERGVNMADGSGDSSTMPVPVAVVTPFGTDLVAQAPLPLHLIPTVAQQQQQQQHRKQHQKQD